MSDSVRATGEKTSSELTDEYLAELLKRDAKNSSLKYSSALGMLPRRPTSAAPKPNTRFLKNILRETDSHNAALKKKEELEARMRLMDMARANEREDECDPRHRKRRRVGDEQRKDESRYERRGKRSADKRRSRNYDSDEDSHYSRVASYHERDGDYERSRRTRRREHGESPAYDHNNRRKEDRHRRRSRSRERAKSTDRQARHRRRRHRYSSDSESEDSRTSARRSRHRRHNRSRSRSPSKTRDRERRDQRKEYRSPSRESETYRRTKSQSLKRSARKHSRSLSHSSASSDPLSSLLGPSPPPDPDPTLRSRGRGTNTTLSGVSKMDLHFNPNYDPSMDVQPPSPKARNLDALDGDDWDLALEAHRDRMKWRQAGANRLREAGFSELDVKKWESRKMRGENDEKGEEDVIWGSKGERREWDRGKEGKKRLMEN